MLKSIAPVMFGAAIGAITVGLAQHVQGPVGTPLPPEYDGTTEVSRGADNPPSMHAVSAGGMLGMYLTDARGYALYIYERDLPQESTCYDACAKLWPPYVVEATPYAQSHIDSAELGVIEREDGLLQATLGGQPLYYFSGDEKPFERNGIDHDDAWHIATP